MTPERAIRALCEQGAVFVFLQPSGKDFDFEAQQRRGYYERIPPEELIQHRREGGRLGIEPASVHCTVIDIDGKKGVTDSARNLETARQVCKHLGESGYIGRFPSLSNVKKSTGKQHVWYRYDPSDEAPCGLNPEGDPYLAGPTTRLVSMPRDDEHGRFDIKRVHGYVDCDHYLANLAVALTDSDGTFSENLRTLIDECRSKPKVDISKLPPVDPSAANAVPKPISKKRLEGLKRHFWSKPENHFEKGTRHGTAYRWGLYAGHARVWWPTAIDEFRARARKDGAAKSTLQQIEKGYIKGCSYPPTPAPRSNKPNWRKEFEAMPTEPPSPDGNGHPPPPIEDIPANHEAPQAKKHKKQPRPVQVGESGIPISISGDDAEGWKAPLVNELAAAEAYHSTTQGNLRWNVERDEWWVFSAQNGWVKRLAPRIKTSIRKFLRKNNPEPKNPRAIRAFDDQRLGDRIKTIESELAVIEGSKHFDQDDLLIGLPDCSVFDVRTGKPRTAKHDDFVTMQVTVTPKKGEMPRFTRFLCETFPLADGKPDWPTIHYLMRWFGYAMTGSTDEHIGLFFQGVPATAKSTMIDIYTLLLGKLAKAVPSRTFIKSQFDEHLTVQANLQGPRVCHFAETGENKRFNEELMNSVIAGDEIGARVIAGNPFNFRPHCKLIMASNHRPKFSGPESGITRRLKLILFKHRVPKKKRIKGLAKTIVQEEGPAIMQWLLQEAHEWYRQVTESGATSGLRPESEHIIRETKIFMDESDILGDFIAARLDVTGSSDDIESSASVYKAYTAWCETQGYRAIGHNSFSTKLINSLSHRGVKRDRDRKIGRIIIGLRALSNIEIEHPSDSPEDAGL